MNLQARGASVLVFGGTTLLFAFITEWLLHNHYSNDIALFNWSSIMALFDADHVRLESLGFSRPHGAMLVMVPLYYMTWLGGYAPYIVSALATGFLLALWEHHLGRNGYSWKQRALLLSVMAINPAVLWSATGGGGESIALLMFYLLFRSCLSMVYEKDIRSFIALGMVLAAFFYFDVISIFIFIALLPLLLLIVPVPMLRESPVSVYIIIGMPLLIIFTSWLYFNWIFNGDPLAFLHAYGSAYAGAKTHAEVTPWLRDYGGQFFQSTIEAFKYIVIGYPVLLYFLYRKYKEQRQLKTLLVLVLHPAIAVGIATTSYFLTSPLQITVLVAAGVMAETTRMGSKEIQCSTPLLLLLLLSAISGWTLFSHDTYSHAKTWSSALTSPQAIDHKGDIALGRWLMAHRDATLLDLQSGYRVIAARGDAKQLILPFTPEFRLAMRSGRPGVAQIAVPDPDGGPGRQDAITRRFPQLYEAGLTGYVRVYDKDGWRVYRHM